MALARAIQQLVRLTFEQLDGLARIPGPDPGGIPREALEAAIEAKAAREAAGAAQYDAAAKRLALSGGGGSPSGLGIPPREAYPEPDLIESIVNDEPLRLGHTPTVSSLTLSPQTRTRRQEGILENLAAGGPDEIGITPLSEVVGSPLTEGVEQLSRLTVEELTDLAKRSDHNIPIADIMQAIDTKAARAGNIQRGTPNFPHTPSPPPGGGGTGRGLIPLREPGRELVPVTPSEGIPLGTPIRASDPEEVIITPPPPGGGVAGRGLIPLEPPIRGSDPAAPLGGGGTGRAMIPSGPPSGGGRPTGRRNLITALGAAGGGLLALKAYKDREDAIRGGPSVPGAGAPGAGVPEDAGMSQRDKHAAHRDSVINRGEKDIDDMHAHGAHKRLYEKAFYNRGLVTHHPSKRGRYIVVNPETFKEISWGVGAASSARKDSRRRANEARILASPRRYGRAFAESAARKMRIEAKRARNRGDYRYAAMLELDIADPSHPDVLLRSGYFNRPGVGGLGRRRGRYGRYGGDDTGTSPYVEYAKEYHKNKTESRELTPGEKGMQIEVLSLGRQIEAINELLLKTNDENVRKRMQARIDILSEKKDKLAANVDAINLRPDSSVPKLSETKFMPEGFSVLRGEKGPSGESISTLGSVGLERRKQFVSTFSQYHSEIADEFKSGIYQSGGAPDIVASSGGGTFAPIKERTTTVIRKRPGAAGRGSGRPVRSKVPGTGEIKTRAQYDAYVKIIESEEGEPKLPPARLRDKWLLEGSP